MGKIFEPIKDLFGAVYDLLFDAAQKVWSLAKPVILIGLAIDLISGKLGWISQILEFYRQMLDYTAGASWMVLVFAALVVLGYFSKR